MQKLLFHEDERTAATAKKMSRRSDPETSKEAARRKVTSGQLRDSQVLVLRTVVAHAGSTYAELAVYAGMDDAEPGRRLPELERLGYVSVMPSRKCRVKQSKCRTWIATEKGLEWVAANSK